VRVVFPHQVEAISTMVDEIATQKRVKRPVFARNDICLKYDASALMLEANLAALWGLLSLRDLVQVVFPHYVEAISTMVDKIATLKWVKHPIFARDDICLINGEVDSESCTQWKTQSRESKTGDDPLR
jgi:hypothetical protein